MGNTSVADDTLWELRSRVLYGFSARTARPRRNSILESRSPVRRRSRHIQELTATPELNKTYLGKVQRITDFGAFVEIMPGTDGLLHVSKIANHRVKDVRDELKEGEQLLVKVINIEPTGKIRLSRKALLQEEGAKPQPAKG
jgi:polyribonucleotide nucleotidyltransferase